MTHTVGYPQGAELPDLSVRWEDSDGEALDLQAGWTLTLTLQRQGVVALAKSTGISAAAPDASPAPNVIVSWAADELDLAPGSYDLRLNARRDSDSKDRIGTGTIIIE